MTDANSKGYMLITSLIFLTVLTLIAVVSTQTSNIGYKMATNTAFKERAFQSSEAARKNIGEVVNEFVYQTGWTGVDLPTGVTVVNSSASLDDNGTSEDLLDDTTLTKDMDFLIDGNADGDYIDGGDIKAEIIVYKTQQGIAPGSSVAMLSAANGVGKGASSAIRIYYEIRSRGLMASGAKSNTATEYRVIPN